MAVSSGDRGDEEIGTETPAIRLAWSAIRLTVVWFSFAPAIVGIEEEEVDEDEDEDKDEEGAGD